MLTVLIGACKQDLNIENSSEVSMSQYYCKDDFQSIVIGESTYQDVYQIAPPDCVHLTAYGGFCEYPMQDGGCLRIKFYGSQMIVGMIEVDVQDITKN